MSEGEQAVTGVRIGSGLGAGETNEMVVRWAGDGR
jgi:hypothetical protein